MDPLFGTKGVAHVTDMRGRICHVKSHPRRASRAFASLRPSFGTGEDDRTQGGANLPYETSSFTTRDAESAAGS